MLIIYTGGESAALKHKYVDIAYPENGLSPVEQVNWIKDNYKRDITISTFSPYIMNYLNVLIAKGELSKDNLKVCYVMQMEDEFDTGKKEEFDLLVTNDKGNLIVDTCDLSEPISDMYQEYNAIINNKK